MTCHRCGQRHAIYEDWAQCLAASLGTVYVPGAEGVEGAVRIARPVLTPPPPITPDELLDLQDTQLDAWSLAFRQTVALA